jgi:hypothetical protein
MCGDNAWDTLEILHDKFGVDFSEFTFDEYFPNEFSFDKIFVFDGRRLLRALGLGKIVDRKYSKYREVTFGMIEESIRQKRLVSSA